MEENTKQQETATSITDMPKRGPLESLAREELIKKCKGLLGIAQKAKQAKDEFKAENEKLTAKISEYETQKDADKKSIMTMKEMVDVLTENKLALTSEVSDIQSKLDKSAQKILEIQETQTQYMDYSIENEALKRQVKRLENENDELLQDLQNMEQKLQQVNEFGKIQKKDLEELEQQTEKWNNMEKKIIMLESDNAALKTQIEDFTAKDKTCENVEEFEKTIESKSAEVIRLRQREQKYIEKIQYLKDKLKDIAMKVQKLKKCKEILLQTQKDYSDSITKWQIDITNASHKLMLHLKLLETEKLELQKKISMPNNEMTTINSLKHYENKLAEMITYFENVKGNRDDNFEEENNLKLNVEQLNCMNSGVCLENENLKQQILSFENKFDQQSLKIDEFIMIEKSLKQELGDLKEGLKCADKEKESLHGRLEDKQQIIDRMQFENTDLLSEMRELNEALKTRGDVISRQQDKISELENEINKYSQKSKKMISSSNSKTDTSKVFLQLPEPSSSSMNDSDSSKNLDSQSEILSVSSMCQTEEVQRLNEVEEHFEEKYNKLRVLAVKLKKKVQEQTQIIMNFESSNSERSTDKSSLNPNLHALQKQNDSLLDQIDQLKTEKKSKDLTITALSKEIEDLKLIISQNETELGNAKEATLNINSEVKEVQSQLLLMKQEKDAFNVIRKQIEKERDDLKIEATKKDKEKQKLSDQLEKSKKELEKLKLAGHQSNVLSLEVEAYEKSLNDISQKLKNLKVKNKEQIDEIESKVETITSLRKEIQILEENNDSEKLHSLELKQQIDIQTTNLKQIEFDKQELLKKISGSEEENELLKSQLDEIKLEISNLTFEKNKKVSDLQIENDALNTELRNLNDRFQDQNMKLKNSEQQLEDMQTEFTSYKVRAQTVLRQNQSKETSRERDLEEELTAMHTAAESFNLKHKKILEQNELNEKKIDELRAENEGMQKRYKDLIKLVDEMRMQNDELIENNRKQIQEYQESLKSNRLQIETLNNCYKSQIEELEHKHLREIEEFKKSKNENNRSISRVGPFGGGAAKSSDEQKIDLILMEREDAEGSEASYSVNKRKISTSSRSRHDMIPLDELLNSNFDDSSEVFVDEVSPAYELKVTKEKLQAQEIRTKHLTTLLADVEQDLVKRTQMNELLKEELRRIERSIDREEHIKNSEYLKNVVFKFITLNNVDERERLVPVLTTILKLSPEESHKLQNAAKGVESLSRVFGNYLPLWPNNNQ